MSSAGIQAGALPWAAICRWPCRPSAWASAGLISLSSSCAPRRSSNGSHWVLSIIWVSPGACTVFTCRARPLYGKHGSLSRMTFRSVNMEEGVKAPLDEPSDHHRESHTLWFNAPMADGQRRPPLTRERVVAEALTVIAEEGVGALTMRTLATRLGVVPGALYRHVRNKEQLQDLVLEGHPGVAGLLQLRDPLGPHSLTVAEAFLGPLQAAGFPKREAGLAFFLVIDYTTGFAVSSPPISINEQRVRDQATRSQLHEFFRSLPADRFPALVALGEHVWVDNRDERFTAGLDVLVDGLQRARRAPRRRPLGGRPATTTSNIRPREAAQQAVRREAALHTGHRSHGDG